ncbi:ACP phosphodiesterase [Rubritalea sp.]|uniref:acyl carrier protein phosphodiesterase n=1 Tax=Rubritalea sp. TaxID=2109375 RepID=UPI003EF15EF0
MNYLAHIALADHTDASRIGNFLGDFAKGTRKSLLQNWPSELVEGFIMHRSIDSFTDSHPTFQEAKQLIAPSRRRLAGIAIDIFYDHFLSTHWHRYYQCERTLFIDQFYQCLERHPDWWIGDFASAYPYLKSENWLGCYVKPEGIQLTLQRISRRNRKWILPIAECYEDFENHYDSFERLFLELYPDLIEHAEAQT